MTDLALFIEYEKRLARKRAIGVGADPLIFAGVKKWPKLDIAQKKLFIERYKRLCEKVMRSGMLKLEFFEEAPQDGSIRRGSYHDVPDAGGWGKPIRINAHPEVLDRADVVKVLSTPPHELTHNYQDLLIANPEILPELFREPISQIMAENKAAYITAQSNHAAYREQPLEQHAFAVGDVFAEAISGFAASRTLLPNKFDEIAVQKEYEAAKSVSHGAGRMEMPMVDGLETTDPYRHYYYAKLQQAKLMEPGGEEYNRWWDILSHNQKALIYGEYLPYDPRPPMNEFYRLAANEFYDDDKNPPKRLQVPDVIQARARGSLQGYAANGEGREARVAAGILRKLERLGPMPPADRTAKKPVRRLQT